MMESSQKRTGSIPIYSCMSAVNISLLVKLQSLQFCDDVILHQERDLFVLPEVRQISPQQFLFALTLTFLFKPFFPPASQGLPEVTVTCPLLQTILWQNLSKLNPHRPSDISYSGGSSVTFFRRSPMHLSSSFPGDMPLKPSRSTPHSRNSQGDAKLLRKHVQRKAEHEKWLSMTTCNILQLSV